MINTVTDGSNVHIKAVKKIIDVASVSIPKEKSVTRDASPAKASLSTLSRQLADSAARAEARDRNMDRRQLGAEANRILMKMVESNWRSDEIGYVTELPDTADSELLERARQATEYVARHVRQNRRAENPFAGLSREQLNLIVYDEAGPYTLHERSAAHSAVIAMESEWNHGLWGPERLESAANNGRTPKFYAEVLAHYRTLEPIEQAQYPDIYESRLERQIQEANDPSSENKTDFELLTLFELLARYGFPADRKKAGILDGAVDSDSPPAPGSGLKTTLKTSN